MRTQLMNPSSLWSTLLENSGRLLMGTLVASMTAIGSLPAIAANAQTASTAQSPASSAASLPDGVYLYGQAAKPDVIGQGYFVFEVNKGNVVGALYMPRSSFDCASGKFQDDQLALTVVNSYDRTTNPFEIALDKTSTVATTGNSTLKNVGLQGFHSINTVSENDRRMLSVCKTDFQQQAKN